MAASYPLLDHLLRRAGFGASPDDLTTFAPLSYVRAVDRLIGYESIPDTVDSHIGTPGYIGTTSNGPFSPNAVINDARQRWLFRMLHSERPLQEKMTLFWHNYFATGYTKVAGAGQQDGTRMMAAKAASDPHGQKGQIETLRDNALGSLNNLLNLMATDPAMLIWLDGNTNTRQSPQENFGRELMELFSRGVGFYTEQDVYAAARVFTGWNLRTTRGSGDLRRSRTIRCDFKKPHAAQNAKHFPGCALRIILADVSYFAVSHHDLESGRLGCKQRGSVFRSHVGDQVAEAVHLQNNGAQAALAGGFRSGSGKAHVVFNLVAEFMRIDQLGQIRRHGSKHVARVKCTAHWLPEIMFRGDVSNVQAFLSRIDHGEHAVVGSDKVVAITGNQNRPPRRSYSWIDHYHMDCAGREV